MTVYERIRLELEHPSGDAVYGTAKTFEYSRDEGFNPWEDDEMSRLKLGAGTQDFELRNESARTVRTLYLNAPPPDR